MVPGSECMRVFFSWILGSYHVVAVGNSDDYDGHDDHDHDDDDDDKREGARRVFIGGERRKLCLLFLPSPPLFILRRRGG